uniref:Uncharacterized protein n=1 Tax=Leersia perrieri TaxID=77586 RepID=A0A0D9W309_9ORYZ
MPYAFSRGGDAEVRHDKGVAAEGDAGGAHGGVGGQLSNGEFQMDGLIRIKVFY